MNNKGIFIKEIKGNTQVKGIFYVDSKKKLETKQAKPYLNITLSDSSGTITGKIWEDADKFDKVFDSEDFVVIDSYADTYNNTIQLNIKNIEKIDENKVDVSHFMPITPLDREALKRELFEYINKISKNSFYRNLIEKIFENNDIFKDYCQCPASTRGHHHSYIGGLLEHSVSICRLIMSLKDNYSYLDFDLLLAGAILHDIGKIRSYNYSKPNFSMTDEGRLLGHITIGTQIIGEYAKKVDNFDNLAFLSLQHLILSHHGTKEMNAVVLPMMEEAFLLHILDYLDATLAYIHKLKGGLKGNSRTWTEYQKVYDRYFFLNPIEASNSSQDDENQADLWGNF